MNGGLFVEPVVSSKSLRTCPPKTTSVFGNIVPSPCDASHIMSLIGPQQPFVSFSNGVKFLEPPGIDSIMNSIPILSLICNNFRQYHVVFVEFAHSQMLSPFKYSSWIHFTYRHRLSSRIYQRCLATAAVFYRLQFFSPNPPLFFGLCKLKGRFRTYLNVRKRTDILPYFAPRMNIPEATRVPVEIPRHKPELRNTQLLT